MPTFALEATAAGTPIIDLDATLGIQMALFLFMWFFVGSMLVKPYLQAKKERESLTSGAREEADRVKARASTVLSDYESKLSTARGEAAAVRDGLVSDGRNDANTLISSARATAEETSAAAAKTLGASLSKAEKKVEPKARELSMAIADKVLA